MYHLGATGVSSHPCVPGGDAALYISATQTALEKGIRISMRPMMWLTLAACLEGVSAGAASLDMSTVTCEPFLQTTDSRTLPIVVGWLIGHHAASDAHAAIDFDKADRSSAELLKVCGDNPSIIVSTGGERLHY